MVQVESSLPPRPPDLPPVVGPRLRRLLRGVFGLFGLLAVNSLYLGGITLLEGATGEVHQDYFYQVMFLVHLVVGLIIIVPVVTFGALHLRNAWGRPNYRAVRAGLALYVTALTLLASGLILTRFDFFELRDPDVRRVAYWLHVITPLLVMWLFVLHRLAGRAISWLPGAAWGTLALVFVVGALFVKLQPAVPAASPVAAGEVSFEPALARTGGGRLIPARALMMDSYCEECHGDVHAQWAHSAHRLSSFNNPAYRFSVLETREVAMRRDGNVRVSRLCAGCHDPVPLFSGVFDRPEFDRGSDPSAEAGITCSACHAITRINSPRGNADYTIEEPRHYPFAYSDSGFLQWLNRQLVKAKPEFHKKTFLKPVHREPLFCSACHKVHLPEALNAYKWLRGQNHFDSYQLSGVSGHGASSFYYPDKAIHACNACHMPIEPSDDFGAAHFDDSGQLKVHDHLFRGANTALPHLLGAPGRVNERHQAFLDKALRVDIFGLKDGGAITGTLHAPIRPEVPVLEPGRRYLLEVVLRTLKLGHWFTQGTSDSNEVWLDVTVSSGGRIIGRSGDMPGDGSVDPWAYFLNSYVLDRDGNRIDRRNAQDIFTALYNHQIPPGAADVVHYAISVPEDVVEPIEVEVRVNYRKFDTPYLRHFQGASFVRNDLPVTVLATDRVVFPIAGGQNRIVAGVEPASAWERWNDYGIALLRKGRRGELRQAEQAFTRVEGLGRADGPLNLARVYLREGRLEEAVNALRRAVAQDPPAPAWVATWLSGLVNKQNGFLDEAIADFERVVATDFADARRREFDFSEDYRVLTELGQTVFERSKQERGPARRERREALLRTAHEWFERALALDPENVTAHYNLWLIYNQLGETGLARKHQQLHERYRVDDNARERAVNLHRRRNPAADHAAEAVVIYDLQRAGASRLGAASPQAGAGAGNRGEGSKIGDPRSASQLARTGFRPPAPGPAGVAVEGDHAGD